MKRKKPKKKFAAMKKTLKDFMRDEDGFVSKDKILKVGLGTVSAVGILGSLSNAYAITIHENLTGQLNNINIDLRLNIPTHSNGAVWQNVAGTSCERLVDHNQMIASAPTVVHADRVDGSLNWDKNQWTRYYVTLSSVPGPNDP